MASELRTASYATGGSFYGLVDLLSILPTYVSVLIPGAQALLVIRTVRILRVFRVLKLAHFLGAAEHLPLETSASSSIG